METISAVIKKTIIKNHMLESGDRCILAVSGGADSMALMHSMNKLKEELGLRLRVVHIHHGLRGEEADRDAEHVRQQAQAREIPCSIIYVDVNSYASENKLSTEEAGRILRYNKLEEEAKRWEAEQEGSPVKIVVAHNKQDNAETILMQLVRGSGLAGLAGIAPCKGRIIRPLLELTREEIEEYLKKENVEWITDSTNLGNDYTRNRVRHEILPLLINQVNKGAINNITRLGKLAEGANGYITKQVNKVIESDVEYAEGEAVIKADRLKDEDEYFVAAVLRKMLSMVSTSMKDVTTQNIEDIRGLLNSQSGKEINLPYGVKACREYENLIIKASADYDPAEAAELFSFRVFEYNGEKPPEGESEKWFDFDLVEGIMETRFRRPGDYIELAGAGRKSISSYMTDKKIPRDKRDRIPLVAIGSHVMWLAGYRISEHYKINAKTEQVLEIEYKGTKDGRAC